MKKHWRLVVVCLALCSVLSACGATPENPDDGVKPKTPTRNLIPKTKEGALEAIQVWTEENATAAAPWRDKLTKDGDFGALKALLPLEADKIAKEVGEKKIGLWVMTRGRAKVVFAYNPDDGGLKVLKEYEE